VRIFWGTVGLLLTVLFLFFLFHPLQPVDGAKTRQTHLDPAMRDAILNADIPDIAKEAIIGHTTVRTSSVVVSAGVKPTPKDDERLRKFDEL